MLQKCNINVMKKSLTIYIYIYNGFIFYKNRRKNYEKF